MTSDTERGPRTEAGKALLDAIFSDGDMPVDPGAAILAIEREAAEEGALRQLERQLHEEAEGAPAALLVTEAVSRPSAGEGRSGGPQMGLEGVRKAPHTSDIEKAAATAIPFGPPSEGYVQRRCWTILEDDEEGVSQCWLYNGHPGDHQWREAEGAPVAPLLLDPERLAALAYADRPPLGKRPVPWPPRLRKDWEAWARRIAARLSEQDR